MFRKIKDEEADRVAPLNFIFDTEKRIRDRHIYDKTIWMDFEYLKMPVPAGYDIYLKNNEVYSKKTSLRRLQRTPLQFFS